ncbi:MAG TPA: aldehyde dehydrogenase family protein [Pirellulaceae bacterium]|nr:aldehyde dehydrogenase family protein [Pirellulaceae bacterium]HMO91624.1 aldehyde dehydrogenase family protein [Pirellulaceae bacterium]HMP68321.1 aldehyde dehydrogenase family protein [Pirellulaceae bacterium]
MSVSYPMILAGKPITPNTDLLVKDKFSGEISFRVPLADENHISQAIDSAERSVESLAQFKPYQRRDVLQYCASQFELRSEELASILCIEAGKPIKDSKGEVNRLIDTFRIAAEEATRIGGEILEMQISPRANGYRGMYKRVPIGPCLLITPFNFPLNLVAHKVAPAIAAGCPFILKPASNTPVGALLIGEILCQTDLPSDSFSILPCSPATAATLVSDDRIKLLSFTGSPDVGWKLKNAAGRKRVLLELGGNAAVIVDENADLEHAIDRILFGTFYQSGQSCIGVQRILVHESIYLEFREQLAERTRQLKSGDPKSAETFIGPLISEQEAIRLESWIEQAVSAGGRLICGGNRSGAILQPTLLEDVPRDARLCRAEAFGPVAVLSRFSEFEQALIQVNDSDFGLQAGVFTNDVHKAFLAWDRLEVGGVIINDVPSWRVDHMPYGGVKQSGLGREGIRFSIEEMTEIRLLVIKDRNKG